MAKFRKYIRAQTAMELAVFGAILIFVIGAIVRQALSAGYMQNQYLRAMRQAMTTSYRYSTISGTASHQTATILFVEDRLTADSAKYGAIDRTPYVVSAAATYSRNLFLPVEAGEEQNLPVFDVFINGKHFPFTVAGFKRVNLTKNCANDPVCPAQCNGDCTSGSLQMYPDTTSPGAAFAPAGPLDPVKDWEPNCVTVTVNTTMFCKDICDPSCTDCTATSTQTWVQSVPVTVGCPKLYGIIYNHGSYLEWCDGEPGGTPCPAGGDLGYKASGNNPDYNLTADERFDLDRSGPPLVTPPDVSPGPDRADFSWQWYLVMGYDATEDKGSVVTLNPKAGAGIVLEPSNCKQKCKGAQYTSVDVDGDLKLEQIMVNTKIVDWIPPHYVFGGGWAPGEGTGVILGLTVMDSQEGDLDMSRGDSDTGPKPGLTKDVKMFTRVQDGTYLQIDEGKLYALVKNPSCVAGCAGDAVCIAACPGDANQYIRTTQQKDQIDLIERVIQLSNDTHRFCDSGGNVVTERLNNDPAKSVIWIAGLPNPVEECNDCWSLANFQRTCMAQDPAGDGTQPPVIYVRSRVVDRRGRKWVTNTSSDAYVDFVTPSVP